MSASLTPPLLQKISRRKLAAHHNLEGRQQDDKTALNKPPWRKKQTKKLLKPKASWPQRQRQPQRRQEQQQRKEPQQQVKFKRKPKYPNYIFTDKGKITLKPAKMAKTSVEAAAAVTKAEQGDDWSNWVSDGNGGYLVHTTIGYPGPSGGH